MKRNQKVRNVAIAGILSALGILIPMLSPFKIMVGESSYTLASHVPIFVAMFVSPIVGIWVTLATAFGFFLSGMPLTVTVRALSHLTFVIPGSLIVRRVSFNTPSKRILLNLTLALIHGCAEFTAVALLNMRSLNGTVLFSYFLFLGLGTIAHSFVDFVLALQIVKPLNLHDFSK